MEYIAAFSLVCSVVALAGVVILFLNRERASNVESKVRSVELELADLVDRLAVWQRRDASRQRRVGGATPDVVSGSEPDQHIGGTVPSGKSALRAVARQRGLIP